MIYHDSQTSSTNLASKILGQNNSNKGMQHSGFAHVSNVSKQCFSCYLHDWACVIRMLDDA